MAEILEGKIYTEQEYFDLEIADPLTKYEFVDGNIYAMSGGTINHAQLAGNMMFQFKLQLKKLNNSCRVFNSDLKVKLEKSSVYFYPDLFVVCDKFSDESGRNQAVSNPRLIVEVLSQSTESYDRGDKFEKYRSLESLQEYVLVNQEKATVETYVRKNDKLWEYRAFAGIESAAHFVSLDISVAMEDIYENVVFAETEDE